MSASLELQDDTGSPVTSFDWGPIDDGTDLEYKFFLQNVGDQSATGVLLTLERLRQTDGVDFALLASDDGGSPDTYSASPLSLGTVVAGQIVPFWIKTSLPEGTSPGGNPRQYTVRVDYRGT